MSMKIVIVGRGHTGKNRLAKAIADHFGLTVLKTSTDRPKRWPEEDTYRFYTKEESAAIPMEDKLLYTEAVDGHGRWADKQALLDADIAILDPSGAVQAVRIWQANGHGAKTIYVIADAAERKASWIRDIAENGGDEAAAAAGFDERERIEAPAFDGIEDMIRKEEDLASADALLYPNACGRKPLVLFNADETEVWTNGFDPIRMEEFAGRIGRGLLQWGKRAGGYRKFWEKEPIVLEPEDWTEAEWRVLMKLLGFEPDITTRAVVHIASLECFIDPEAENAYKEARA